MDISQEIESIRSSFEQDSQILDKDSLYLKYFSKNNGVITLLIKEIPNLTLEEKKTLGPQINYLNQELLKKIDNLKVENRTVLDESIKILKGDRGKINPITQTINEMNSFFKHYGFSIVEGPEIETEEYNFRKLNLPENHPATDLQDTLYLKGNKLLRTHTSSIETRILTDYNPPIRAVAPGKVFRNETPSATNSSFFHQYQGIVVDQGISIKNLKQTLIDFHEYLFGTGIVLRFRYKYYPEVSPGMGTDIRCQFCHGEGCRVCKYRGYIEVLGSGMIHYNTLKMCGIDPEIYTGFAFGMGLSRLVMQKYQIDDIRKLYQGGMFYQW